MNTTTTNKNEKPRYTAADFLTGDLTIAAASRADYVAAALTGYRYALRRHISYLQDIDSTDRQLETIGCHAVRYDRPAAGRSSVPNRADPGSEVINLMTRRDVLIAAAEFWRAEMEKAHKVIRDLMRTTDTDTVDMILRYYDLKQTYREIADHYGLSIATTRGRILRALSEV